jgi:hypothetical protein
MTPIWSAIFGSGAGKTRGGGQWGDYPESPRFRLQTRELNAILRADRPVGGLRAASRNRTAPALLGDA